ncbi:MAG TPA: thiamine phosphate synthase [bacterium]|nr:thiamine phosphate synthase [bacterium]HOL34596.1 thiamine phosphate synthase [bacterium]HPP08158.1 thiamine phosphate synthase [bacterium]
MKIANPLRIIDANFNRVREALRVIEDTLRFSDAGKNVSSKIRSIKHLLSNEYFKTFGYRALTARDVTTDHGKRNQPYSAETLKQILIRNFMRAEEGLRCIEECSRIVSPDSTGTWQALRFKIYDIEQQIITRIPDHKVPAHFSGIYTETDIGLEIIKKISTDIFIMKPGRNIKTCLEHLKKIKNAAKKAIVLVEDRPDIALVANVDGVHLEPEAMSPEHASKIIPGKIIGVAARDVKLQKFHDTGASYIAFYNYCEIVRLLTKHKKNIKLLIAAIVNSRQEAKKAIEQGADGVIIKSDIPQEIIEITGLVKELYGKET